MIWLDDAPKHTTHRIETERPQKPGFMRRFKTDQGDVGEAWFKPEALCQLQVIIPGNEGLLHGKPWAFPEQIWDEAAAVVVQFEAEEACEKHTMKMSILGDFYCVHCGQQRETRGGSRIDG